MVGHGEWYRALTAPAVRRLGRAVGGASLAQGGEPECGCSARAGTAASGEQAVAVVSPAHGPHSPYYPPPPYDSLFYSKDPCSRKLPNTMNAVRAFKPFADYLLSWLPPPGIRDAEFVIAQYDGALAYGCVHSAARDAHRGTGVADNTLIITHGRSWRDAVRPRMLVRSSRATSRRWWCRWSFTGRVHRGGRAQQGGDASGGLRADAAGHHGAEAWPGASSSTEFRSTPCWTPAARRGRSSTSPSVRMRKHGWRTPIWKFWESLEPDFHGKPPWWSSTTWSRIRRRCAISRTRNRKLAVLRSRMNADPERCRATGKRNPIELHEIGLDRRIGSHRNRPETPEKMRENIGLLTG